MLLFNTLQNFRHPIISPDVDCTEGISSEKKVSVVPCAVPVNICIVEGHITW